MFDIGWGELLVIGVIALIVIGPKELPTVLRTLGQYMGKVKRMANEFQGQFQEALREAELTDLKQQAEELTSSVKELTQFDALADTQKAIETSFEAEPNSEAAAQATEPASDEAAKSDMSEPSDKHEASPSEPVAESAAPAAVAEAPLEKAAVALPEPPAPVNPEEFAPPPKPAGDSA